MSRKRKPQAKPLNRRIRSEGEDRASVALTVAWMLAALATLIATAVVLFGEFLLWQFPPQSDDAQPFAFVPDLFLLVATATGMLCLVLTPVVYRVRQDPPPRSIAALAVVAGLLPLAIIAWHILFKSPA